MIFDSLANFERYEAFKEIHTALIFLTSIDPSTFPVGETVSIEGIEATAALKTPVTKSLGECIFESHRKCIDIHYIIEGVEGIGVRNTAELVPASSFNMEKDIGFYHGEPHAVCYIHSGEFLVCYPEDAHEVAIMKESPAQVKKIIVKISINERKDREK